MVVQHCFNGLYACKDRENREKDQRKTCFFFGLSEMQPIFDEVKDSAKFRDSLFFERNLRNAQTFYALVFVLSVKNTPNLKIIQLFHCGFKNCSYLCGIERWRTHRFYNPSV